MTEQAQHEATARELARALTGDPIDGLLHSPDCGRLYGGRCPCREIQAALRFTTILSALTAATAQQAEEAAHQQNLKEQALDELARIRRTPTTWDEGHAAGYRSAEYNYQAQLAQQADEIARLTAVVDSLRELQHQDEDRLAARDAEIARLTAALVTVSKCDTIAAAVARASIALSEGTRT